MATKCLLNILGIIDDAVYGRYVLKRKKILEPVTAPYIHFEMQPRVERRFDFFKLLHVNKVVPTSNADLVTTKQVFGESGAQIRIDFEIVDLDESKAC